MSGCIVPVLHGQFRRAVLQKVTIDDLGRIIIIVKRRCLQQVTI